MPTIPNKVTDRLAASIKRFQPVLASAQSRDVNESDTVIIITDMLSEVFGYDKYSEVTSEKAIRGTFCDLATKVDGTLLSLIEAKAVNQELKDSFVKQAVDYAANQGVDWVILTNGIAWQVYKVAFTKPIGQELVFEVNFLTLNHRDLSDLELLFLLTKEGWMKSAIGEYYSQKQALSRFSVAAMVLSDSVVAVVRRELKRLSPDVKIETEKIRDVLQNEVLKREVVEGDKAEEAHRKIARIARTRIRSASKDLEIPVAPEQPPALLPSSAPCVPVESHILPPHANP
jgi:predicted type IV restriction endonuclease